MLRRIVEAHYVAGFRVWIRFSDGAEGDVDLSQDLTGQIFAPLICHTQRTEDLL
jgi:hypothetical protein